MTSQKISTLLCAAVVAFGLATAPVSAQTTTGGEATAPAATASAYDASSTLATVEGTEVKLGELIALRANLPEQYQTLPDEVLSQGLMDQIIDQTLMEKAARAEKLDENLATALSLRNQVRAVLADAYMRAELERRLTPERIQQAYDETYANAEPVEEVKAAHILVETEDEAKAIKAELDGGADFAALAAKHGTDGTATRGGSLGWFVHDDMVPEFADAAFAMQPGEISAPVKSPFGWHVIKLEERRPRVAPPLDQVRDEIIGKLTQTVQQEIVTDLRAGARIEKSEPPVPAEAIRADDLVFGAE